MYFCPKCNYSFDISKTVSTNTNDDKPVIKKVSDIIKKIEDNEDISQYRLEFKSEELEKNIKYKKLSDKDKEKINILFHINNIAGAQFICNNCNYIKEITESLVLYKYEANAKNDKNISIENNELIVNNPILPRTHDYICKNIDCPTNKKNNSKKEAVFYRDKDSYRVNYVCCICYYNW
jgi:DNA-directed RNA polymerase subunit M/transcription elongation factor TFIIS